VEDEDEPTRTIAAADSCAVSPSRWFARQLMLASLLALPVPDFWITVRATTSASMRWSRLGLVMLTGVAGLTSFGQAAFVGVGAYAAAFCTSVKLAAWLARGSALPWIGVGCSAWPSRLA
jgi:ABC-type branched-subunit amino acid transport system permease subunit